MKKDLIAIKDLTPAEILTLLKSAAELKKSKNRISQQLKGKVVALIFQKPSNRTRVSFEVGVYQLGGRCIYMNPGEINLGKRETAADVARTLSRYVDAIVARTFRQEDVDDLAKYASIPVINGLSDLYHPCQALADILTIQEKFKKFKNVTVAYVGDGNNVCHSLMVGCAKVGVNVNIATPVGYEPNSEVTATAQVAAQKSGSRIMITQSPKEAVKNTQVIYTDVWTSMGQEEEAEKRRQVFPPYQVNADLLAHAASHAIVMHCLPAHRGEEITDEVADGSQSRLFPQAENRLHAQKGILVSLLGEEGSRMAKKVDKKEKKEKKTPKKEKKQKK